MSELKKFGHNIIKSASKAALTTMVLKKSSQLAEIEGISSETPIIIHELDEIIRENVKNLQSSPFYKPIDYDKKFDPIPEPINDKTLHRTQKICPHPSHYILIKPETNDITRVIKAVSRSDNLLKFTLHSEQRLEQICFLAQTVWNEPEFDEINKRTFHEFIQGFPENEDSSNPLLDITDNIHSTLANPIMKQHFKSEVDKGRFVPVLNWPYKKGCFAADLCIQIPKENGTNRFVTNGLTANKHTYAPDYAKQPSADTIFEHNHLFDSLIGASSYSIYDYKDFYRQIPASPESWKFSCLLLGRASKYIDLYDQQGKRCSSKHAQSMARLGDFIINNNVLSRQFKTFALCLQDDRFIMNPSQHTSDVVKIWNNSMGLELNDSKTRECVEEVKWAGYYWNARKKTLRVTEKRIRKMKEQFTKVTTQIECERRVYASFIGCVFSARLIYHSEKISLSPLLFNLRRTANLREMFYDNTELEKSDYDVLIQCPSPAVINEMSLALDIVTREVSYEKVCIGFRRYQNQLDGQYSISENDLITLSDASLYRHGGYCILPNLKAYAFSNPFPRYSKIEKLSISQKELFSSITSAIFGILIARNTNQKIGNIVSFIDNQGAQSLMAGGKVSLESESIAQMMKVFQSIITVQENLFIFQRISTARNKHSDNLSRNCITKKDVFNPAENCIYDILGDILI